MKYAFMRRHIGEFRLSAMCRMLGVHRSGYYVWVRQPLSRRAQADKRLTTRIKDAWEASGRVYGQLKVTRELRDEGEGCSRHRVGRLMRLAGVRAQVGYGRCPRPRGGKVSAVAGNVLDRQFSPTAPDRAWVTDITYIRTHEGWLYLAIILDLFSRKVVGWATATTQHADLVLQALLGAVWRRKPAHGLVLHSDQGCQFTSEAWQAFLKAHGIVCSMSRRGNCHDNAVAESFFQLLKRERVRRRIYPTRDAARADLFDYIEMFYNPRRQHSANDGLSPVQFEQKFVSSGS